MVKEVPDDHGGMIVDLSTRRMAALEQVRAFVDGSAPVDYRPLDRASTYAFVEDALRRFAYRRLDRADKGVLRRFLSKSGGCRCRRSSADPPGDRRTPCRTARGGITQARNPVPAPQNRGCRNRTDHVRATPFAYRRQAWDLVDTPASLANHRPEPTRNRRNPHRRTAVRSPSLSVWKTLRAYCPGCTTNPW